MFLPLHAGLSKGRAGLHSQLQRVEEMEEVGTEHIMQKLLILKGLVNLYTDYIEPKTYHAII